MPSASRLRSFVFVVLGLTLGLAGFEIYEAQTRFGKPWIGFAILPNGEVGLELLSPPAISRIEGGPKFQDLVVGVNGTPVETADDIRAAVADLPIGSLVRYRLEYYGEYRETEVPIVEFSEADWRAVFLPFLVGGVLTLLLGAAVALARPLQLSAQTFFLMTVGLTCNLGFLTIDYFVAHRFVPWGLSMGFLMTAALNYLGLIFPSRLGPAARAPGLVAAITAALHGAFWITMGVALYTDPDLVRTLDYVEFGMFELGFLLLVGNLFWSLRSPEPKTRQQARVMIISGILTVPGGFLFDALLFGFVDYHIPTWVYMLPAWAMSVVLAYAMIAHNLFELDSVVRRGMTAALIALGAVGIQIVLTISIDRWLDGVAGWVVAGTATVLLVALVTAIAPLRQGIESVVERTLFPRLSSARAAVHGASRDLARAKGEADLIRILRRAARESVSTESIRLLVSTPGEPFREVGSTEREPLEIASTNPLAAVFRRRTSTNFAAPRGGRRAPSKGAVEEAARLEVALCIPLPPSEERTAALALGPRDDGRFHNRDDEILLETLAGQAAVALDNARAWEAVHELEDKLRAENVYLREEIEHATDATGDMVGNSPALRAVIAQLDRVAPTDAPVLIHGETGTGKELLVRALHERSARAQRILVKVACAALPENLLESELFGYERGAFTGASTAKSGRFEVADGGTLLLDDVDTLPQGVQAKLLRVLQEGELQRLGSNKLRHVNVRVVAATNRDLLDEVRAGRFREDLYYRLNVVPLSLPPLRERIDDIPALVESFIRKEAPALGRTVTSVAAEAMTALQAYHWPGNIRELRNVVQRALVLSQDEVLRLPGPLEGSHAQSEARTQEAPIDDAPLADQLKAFKIRVIRAALSEAEGNQRIAAERLGLHRQSLTRMIRDLGIQDAASTTGARRPRARSAGQT